MSVSSLVGLMGRQLDQAYGPRLAASQAAIAMVRSDHAKADVASVDWWWEGSTCAPEVQAPVALHGCGARSIGLR